MVLVSKIVTVQANMKILEVWYYVSPSNHTELFFNRCLQQRKLRLESSEFFFFLRGWLLKKQALL